MSDEFALQAWSTAEYHFALALMQPEDAAGVTVHQAYYAMFHAARAVLLRATGSAPKKHSSVIAQFGLLVRNRPEALKRAARDLNKLEDSRIIADYAQVRRLSTAEAYDALSKAQECLELCAAEFGFARTEGSGHG